MIALNKVITYFLLAVICLGTVFLVAPLMNRNVDDPNLIAYFDHDEAFIMDSVWYYYSGEKRESFQYESDYGVELLYLSDFSRRFLSKFLDLTPGIFVLFLRWLHLAFWIAALLALWRLMRHHFGGYWQALWVVFLLAVSPAFPYLIRNLKPESIVLFFMILGLDYLLRFISRPSWKNLLIIVACASVATLIKFAGIFLLPVTVMAMYFVKPDKENQTKTFPTLKIAWIFPAVIGLIFVALPLVIIFFYVRQTSGLTWYKQFGLWNSLFYSTEILYFLIGGVLLIGFSFMLKILNRSKSRRLKNANSRIQLLLSYSTIVLFLFVLFSVLFGLRWIANPKYFIQTCATFGKEAQINIISTYGAGFMLASFKFFLDKIKEFGHFIFISFILYLLMEIKSKFKSLKQERVDFFKRLILAIFVLEGIACMCLPIRFSRHHMLPFFIASAILIVQTIRMVYLSKEIKTCQKNILLSFFITAMVITSLQNVKISTNSIRYLYHWREDVVFDISRWWRKHYSLNTSIVADHPVNAYLPSEYKNAVFLKFQKDKLEQLRNLVNIHKPQLVYYNSRSDGANTMPPIKEILPNNEVRLVASFNGASKYYKRDSYSSYLVYEIKY